ncbi:hypothetical protein [Paraburkholderia unamae]|uniref:Uncharacterized protein n=1 Tax=Paraburkholderia unamae TaxID=219649 RepID=A0ABX5KIG8_9BURK|nr:hypothetical protein [Paraburkholderia unamae]PVX77209.1 hypothetical protein C7402_115268 [Paraburkholderia unamae]
MFSLADQLTKIVSTTPVSEKHGKDRVSALSIGLYVVLPSAALDHFDTALRPSIWRKPMPKPGDLPLESDELTELRFPFMRDYAWSRKYEGYLLRVHIGATGSEDVLLGECGIKDIRFVAQEGGSVGIGFKVTAHPKDEHDLGKICTRLQQEVIVTLTPPDKPVDLFSGQQEEESDDERDPFEGSDLAEDETRIEPTPEKKRGRRAVTH